LQKYGLFFEKKNILEKIFRFIEKDKKMKDVKTKDVKMKVYAIFTETAPFPQSKSKILSAE